MDQMIKQNTEESISARVERLPLSRWHTRMMAIAGLAHFSDAFDSLAIAFVLPILVGLWKIAPAEIGFLISAGYVGQMIGAIGFGWLAERIGRRGALRATVLVISVMSLACAFSWNYLSFFVFRTIQGLGLGGEVPVAATYMNEVSAARFRGRIVIFLQSAFGIGIVITSLVSIWIVPNLGWQWMFIIGALPAILAVWLRWLMPESPRWLASQGRVDEANRVVEKIEGEVTKAGAVLPPLASSFPALIKEKATFASLFKGQYAARTVSVWLVMLCTSIVGYGLLTWMPTIYRTVLKVPVAQALQYGLAGSVASLLGVFATAFLVDIIGRRAAFMIGFFGSAIALGVLWKIALTVAPIYVVILAGTGLFFISFLLSGLYLYVPEIYPTRMRAMAMGVGSAWLRIGAIVGPTLVGWILGASDLTSVFLMFAVAAVVGGLAILFFAVETRGRVLEEVAP
ncbi:MFS transporter [Pseudolabrys sp. FHR47]|uniref:MFS transporter n=1 Tax=Pseudolabrys sp. FHR47 TaxID=2562284 RepID=UPI0019802D5B|nr:MFS transporter [Pseudolabrys sp. FHR47]